ncbi:AraC family transcriptional regulator, partial [Haematococcus lacustris]
VQSGETFSIEMVSHHNGDMYDWIIKGDAALEDIYNFNSTSQTISMRGRSGRADGKHIMTGPVYICGAEPGDTLKIEILDLKPRRNPITGKAFSSNGVTDWGWQRRIEGSRRTDSTFIYELIMDADGYAMYAEPRLSFTWKDAAGNPLVRSLGIYTISGFNYTCVDGYVMLGGYHCDAALEDIYNFNSTSQTISMRGRSGRADGKHIMTGPVYICGAEPGDTLKIEILDLKPRRNPMTGKAFSSNGVTDWGWQRRIEGSRRTDSTFIYELIMDADGYAMYAEPRLSFTWKDAAGNPLVRVPCWPFNGTLTGMNNQTLNWSNPFQSLGIYTISGFNYTCVDGYVMLGGYHCKWRLPVSPHIGNIGLASDVEDTVNSAWPMRTGDCHAGQTNSEYSGTALETNFNGRLRVTVIKANDPTISPLVSGSTSAAA